MITLIVALTITQAQPTPQTQWAQRGKQAQAFLENVNGNFCDAMIEAAYTNVTQNSQISMEMVEGTGTILMAVMIGNNQFVMLYFHYTDGKLVNTTYRIPNPTVKVEKQGKNMVFTGSECSYKVYHNKPFSITQEW